MSTLNRPLLILALLLAATAARSDGIYNSTVGGWGFPDGINNSAVVPAGIGSALLIDNASPALLIDNTNPACLAGGC